MKYYYVPTLKTFMIEGIHPNIPSGSIALTETEYKDLFHEINDNRKVVEIIGGKIALKEPVISVETILAEMEIGLQNHLDSVAKGFGYDNIMSAISYADEPSVPKFQREGMAFRKWRSLFWVAANQHKSSVLEGDIQPPATIDDLIEILPKFNITLGD